MLNYQRVKSVASPYAVWSDFHPWFHGSLVGTTKGRTGNASGCNLRRRHAFSAWPVMPTASKNGRLPSHPKVFKIVCLDCGKQLSGHPWFYPCNDIVWYSQILVFCVVRYPNCMANIPRQTRMSQLGCHKQKGATIRTKKLNGSYKKLNDSYQKTERFAPKNWTIRTKK